MVRLDVCLHRGKPGGRPDERALTGRQEMVLELVEGRGEIPKNPSTPVPKGLSPTRDGEW